MWKYKIPQIAKSTLSRKNFRISDLTLDYRAIVIKTACFWNRIEDPERNSDTYSHLIFEKASKTYTEAGGYYLTNCAGNTGYE